MSTLDEIKWRIKNMTRDQKYEELRLYLWVSGKINIDIDKIKADQVILGAPDSALDTALLRGAVLSGSMLGGNPMTAPELQSAMAVGYPGMCKWLAQRLAPIQPRPISDKQLFSLRRRAARANKLVGT